MTPSPYDLLLHCLFYLNPNKSIEIKQAYPELADWKSQLEHYISSHGLTPDQAQYVRTTTTQFNFDQFMAKLEKEQVQVLSQEDPAYPGLLRHIPDAPQFLFYRGSLSALDSPLLGVVGPRQPSDYGRQATSFLVKGLCSTFGIVSGLAAGIDAIAHQIALSEKKPTVAVIGTSFDTVYPSANRGLFDEICERGLVVTEYPFGIQTKGYHFSRRNRIISGMSRGILVVEAGEKSGALVSARYAVEQNREVFVVPGSIFSELSVGTHRLIQDGAKLVTSAADVCSEFYEFSHQDLETAEAPPPVQLALPLDLSPDEAKVLACLNPSTALGLDEISTQTGLMIHLVLQALTLLEMNGHVSALPGQRFIRPT